MSRLTPIGDGEILVLDNLHRGYSRESLSGTVEFQSIDIRVPGAVAKALRGSEIMFHVAAQSNVIGAVAEASYSFHTNVLGTYNVLQSAARAGVKRPEFRPSSEGYWDALGIPVPETAPWRAKNAYGASKIAWKACCLRAAQPGLEAGCCRSPRSS